MTAKSIMSGELVTVGTDVTVGEALLMMSRHRVHNLPVVDQEGCFVGLLSLRRLTHELLPTAAHVDEAAFHMDLGFLGDDSDEYLVRLQEIGKRPVSDLLEKKKKLRFCEPDTPIPRLLQLLSENPTSLPVLVVEGKRRRVIGMVSNWDVLTKIAVRILAPQEAPDTATPPSAPKGGE
jgi:CBS-domain-containing membrane protein